MDVDLHMHSNLSNLRGDSVTFKSIDQSIGQMMSKGIKHFSFTEHDKFSSVFINEVLEYLKKQNIEMKYYPGVELTINKQDGTPGHILFIFKNHKYNDEIESLTKTITTHYNCRVSKKGLDKFCEALEKRNIEAVIIPHLNKSNGLVYEDGSKEFWSRVKFVESMKYGTKTFKRIQEQTGNEYLELTFSDTHHWREYELPKINNEDTLSKLKEELGND